jgi:hypothetical protein
MTTAGDGTQPPELRTMDTLERPHLEAFRTFYAGLASGPHWFLFFTGGLLNIVDRCLRFLPEDLPAVLVGSALSEEEIAWLRRTYPQRPLHPVPLAVDDKTVWEFLFDVATADFGWIDIDCFVLDPSLLQETRASGDHVALSGPYCFAPRPILRTHLLWLAADAVATLREQVPTSPATYAYRLTGAQRFPPHSLCRLLERRHIAHIGKVIELDGDNQPVAGQEGILELYSNGITMQSSERALASTIFSPDTRRLFPIFDTLVVVQLVLWSMGYQSRVVRGGLADISPAAVHWKSISYHRRLGVDLGDLTTGERRRLPTHHRWTLLADALLMFELMESPGPPAGYEKHVQFLSDRLAQEGFTLRTARRELARHLVESGVDADLLDTDERWSFLSGHR